MITTRHLIYAFLSLVLLVACAKENIDDIVIEDLVFEPDTEIELGGYMRVWTGEQEIFNEMGYAYECKGFNGDTTFYRISNDIYLSQLTTASPFLNFIEEGDFTAIFEFARVQDSFFLTEHYWTSHGALEEPYRFVFEGEPIIEITNVTADKIEGRIEGE
ncbi:MAG: hypothetical protein AAF738_04640, partial [Bacteroidota bacterium]